MNLIQQAVERASQMEREGKLAADAPRLSSAGLSGSGLSGVHSRSFRPDPISPSRVPLAAVGLAVLALLGGAALYVTLAQSKHDAAEATPRPSAQASVRASAAAQPKAIATAAATAPAAITLPATTPVAVAAALPSVLPATTSAAPATVSGHELDDARTIIESWARAWSERDVSGYLAHYGSGFAPERGMSRSSWEKTRRQAIQRRQHIEVSVANLRLEQVSTNRIVARYMQDYAADTYRETGTPKRLVLEREGSGWRIVAESADKAGTGSS